MFDWLFKRSSQGSQESQGFIEPKLTNGQGTATDEQAQLENTEQELIQIRDTLAQMLPSMGGKVAQLQTQLDEASAKNLLLQDQLEQIKMQQATGNDAKEQEKLSEQLQVNIKEIDDLRTENQILLSGMFETQEALEQQILTQQDFEQAKAELDGRFERLIKRYANYVDYGELKITSVDGVAEMPEIVWEMTDVFYAGTSFKKISFKSLLKEGKVGILVMSFTRANNKAMSFKNIATIFPELCKADAGQQTLLRQIRTSHWHAISAAVAAIELSIKTQWRELTLPSDFDAQFWGGCFRLLSRDFSRIPKVLRFESVKLKQEITNSDYEHLWFELFDVGFGNVNLPKFEFRMAASQVTPKDFSTFPKLEIPLIDGKTKPFESWFEESFDDYGPKFELRFDLTKKVFDLGVWSKLSLADGQFISDLVNTIPIMLALISKVKVRLNRPFEIWHKFFRQVSDVMSAYLFVSKKVFQKMDRSQESDTEVKMVSTPIDEFQPSLQKGVPENKFTGNTKVISSELKQENDSSQLISEIVKPKKLKIKGEWT